MEVSENKFDLLANYLAPRFGNIYDVPNGDYEAKNWTDDLREAVRHLLSMELPTDVADRLFRSDLPERSDAPDLDEHIEHMLQLAPWEVAFEVYLAAVEAAPTLRDMIGDLDDWPFED